jgi:hypothetical protein
VVNLTRAAYYAGTAAYRLVASGSPLLDGGDGHPVRRPADAGVTCSATGANPMISYQGEPVIRTFRTRAKARR